MTKGLKKTIALTGLLALFALPAPAPGQSPVPGAEQSELVSQFWRAQSASEIEQASNQLLAASAGTVELYGWLKQGPAYASDVPLGEQVFFRTAADGTEFPYMVYIPEDYDPTLSYAVEFVLHGGVSRPKPEPGENFWQRSLDRIAQPGRITVVPSSWAETFWWQDSQAENLSAILRELKQRYNVDEDRVTLTGISDGATGVFFFAFKQPTEWAAFLPYIGHPGVLRNPQSGGGYRLYFENLMARPLYIVNGENDRLYPAASLQSFIGILVQEGIDHRWRVIAEGGHNTDWLPDEQEAIERFKADNPRDPFPDTLQWVVDRTDRYNRIHWIRVDATEEADNPSLLKVERDGNDFTVDARGVSQFTLLLSPDEVDFNENIRVHVNGETRYDARVTQDSTTLLRWARQDLDRSLLVTAELSLTVK